MRGISWGPLRPGAPVPAGDNGGACEVLGIPRLGIPSLQQADSAMGGRIAPPQSRYATLLPSVLGAAASWNPTAGHMYGNVMAASCGRRANQSIAAAWT